MTRVVGLNHYIAKALTGEVLFIILWRNPASNWCLDSPCSVFIFCIQRVSLVRDHRNNHDQWAIRVLNQHGDQLGNVAREEARDLAPLMDSGFVVYQALIPSTNMGGWRLPHSVSVPWAQCDVCTFHA